MNVGGFIWIPGISFPEARVECVKLNWIMGDK
jgi:hypothetical protein